MRAIVRAWRELTSAARGGPGTGTLIACSGGADSMALVVALSRAGERERAGLVVGHVVHDLRSEVEAFADRDAVRALAAIVELAFVEASVFVRDAGENLEAAARKARYRALGELARRHGLGHVATAHHAEDQLETMLMALVRGAGARGLSGMPERRAMGVGGDGRGGVLLVRPMLRAAGIGKAVCQQICGDAGVAWREDASNGDTSKLRSAIRHRILPELLAIRPAAAARAVEAASVLRDAQRLIDRRAGRVVRGGVLRSRLAGETAAVVGEVVRRLCMEASGGVGADAWGRRAMGPVVRAIREGRPGVRIFTLRGVDIRIDERTVTASRKGTT